RGDLSSARVSNSPSGTDDAGFSGDIHKAAIEQRWKFEPISAVEDDLVWPGLGRRRFLAPGDHVDPEMPGIVQDIGIRKDDGRMAGRILFVGSEKHDVPALEIHRVS